MSWERIGGRAAVRFSAHGGPFCRRQCASCAMCPRARMARPDGPPLGAHPHGSRAGCGWRIPGRLMIPTGSRDEDSVPGGGMEGSERRRSGLQCPRQGGLYASNFGKDLRPVTQTCGMPGAKWMPVTARSCPMRSVSLEIGVSGSGRISHSVPIAHGDTAAREGASRKAGSDGPLRPRRSTRPCENSIATGPARMRTNVRQVGPPD